MSTNRKRKKIFSFSYLPEVEGFSSLLDLDPNTDILAQAKRIEYAALEVASFQEAMKAKLKAFKIKTHYDIDHFQPKHVGTSQYLEALEHIDNLLSSCSYCESDIKQLSSDWKSVGESFTSVISRSLNESHSFREREKRHLNASSSSEGNPEHG